MNANVSEACIEKKVKLKTEFSRIGGHKNKSFFLIEGNMYDHVNYNYLALFASKLLKRERDEKTCVPKKEYYSMFAFYDFFLSRHFGKHDADHTGAENHHEKPQAKTVQNHTCNVCNRINKYKYE